MTLESYIAGLQGRRVAVLGIGVSNTPLIELLLQNGCQVTACDRRLYSQLGKTAQVLENMGARLQLGYGYLQGLDHDVIFRTPGLHPHTPEILAARERGSVITSEMEVFFSLCPAKIFAVTGSDGKTTTTTIIAELLRSADKRVFLGGNIGKPLLTQVDNMDENSYAVLELSSFQLHSMYCRPHVAVITNISPNHLDVHPDMKDYVDAKRMIYKNQDASCRLVLNREDACAREMAGDAKSSVSCFSSRGAVDDGAFLMGDDIYFSGGAERTWLMKASEIRLPGLHNVENYLAAFAATRGYVDPRVCARVARRFTGVPHRLELVRSLRGVSYYNDSIASSPTRTIAGLKSFDQRPILIAGGYDKQIPFDELGFEINKRAKRAYLTGDTAEAIQTAITSAPNYDGSVPVSVTDDFRQAVLSAHEGASEGDIVLLSPACASFDKFENFARRGEYFKEIIMGLE